MYMFRCEVHFAFDRKMHQVLHCILKKAISTFRHNSKVSLFNQNSTFCNNASSFLLCRTLKLDPWPRMAALFSLKALWCSKSNTSWFHFQPRMTSQFPVGVLLPSFLVTSIECEGNDVIIRHLGVLKRGYTHRRWMGHDFVSQGCDINLTCFPSYTHMKVLLHSYTT